MICVEFGPFSSGTELLIQMTTLWNVGIYKLNSRLRRTEAVRQNVQNAISYLQVQDGATICR